MKKTHLILASVLCLLCASCEKEQEDARDAVIGGYSFTQSGSATISYQGTTVTTLPLDDEGNFHIDKNTSTTTGLYFYGGNDFLIEEGYIANGNTLVISDVHVSDTFDGLPVNYTVKFSLCEIVNRTFTVEAIVSGSLIYDGTSFPVNGRVLIHAQGR